MNSECNVNLDHMKWKCLDKDDNIDLKTGYIISLLPEGKYAYKIVLRENICIDKHEADKDKKASASNISNNTENIMENKANLDDLGNYQILMLACKIKCQVSPSPSKLFPLWIMCKYLIFNNVYVEYNNGAPNIPPESKSAIKPSDKNRVLPTWMCHTLNGKPKTRDVGHSTEFPSTSIGNVCKNKLPKTKEQFSASECESAKNGNNDCSKENEVCQSRDMKGFLRNWNWAIQSVEDYNLEKENKPEGHLANNPQIKKNSNKEKINISSHSSNEDKPWYETAFDVANSEEEPHSSGLVICGTKESASKMIPSTPNIQNRDHRISCRFGTSCYRKNSQHRIEEAHPGDNDYKETKLTEKTEDEDNPANEPMDTRPECEYGLHCYRKNPQHRNDYKHTSRPRAAKRKAKERTSKMAKKQSGEHLSGESEEYESDFINDISGSDEEDISSDEEDVDEWKPEDEGDD